jgi:hypothetical protein
MQHSALFFFAERLSDRIMQEWPADEILECLRKAGLLEGRKVPRIPTDFGARYRGIDDADEVDTKVISVATLVMSRILCIEIPRQ